MNTYIPKIIHQIWSGIDEPLPKQYATLGETWKYDYPNWIYLFWDNTRMNTFIQKYYPQYWDIYSSFPYNILRWDTIRYLILEKIGGMYVDFDYESLEPMTDILSNNTCCFSEEPPYHRTMTEEYFSFNNALMISIPNHPFMKQIINTIFSTSLPDTKKQKKYQHVFGTTGPWLINRIYNNLNEDEKKSIYLIPFEKVSPVNMYEARLITDGIWDFKLQEKIKNAYAIHYYSGSWN